MAPKVSKKTVTSETPVESPLEAIKQEWFTIVKEITSTTEKLSTLEKKRDELVSKLWDVMNKNPTEPIVEAEPVEEKKSSVKSSAKKTAAKNEIIDDSENADSVKPVAKAKAKTVKAKVEEEEPKAETKPVAKTTKTKTKAKEDKPEEKAEVKPVVKKTPVTSAKKISAPVKGTPKPKIDEDSDDEKPRAVISGANDSSSESDVDSLSSVSSESEASGNED